ncbi:MAG: Transcriptional regulator TrmB [Candidatus Uhrbacteria bacterium GW2011_GWA2_53_10]|uniref:Transcriptional regulator TrmB n=1 Tax=Candidatus Uhrbacteria bacterium GW2011_GWA2_53_10 TaxID=1618980 RepID=A0A0G1XQV9_9BACT|nr:MAG: Transcriptional regulator TrmB [Candidatus Uhrbacteria bacterium GW2011_GWA2_53_10]
MATDIPQLLTALGLTPTETKIYLASLSLGPTSVQEIAKKAKLSRTAAYDAIESLQQRGLMSSFLRDKKRFFIAEDPENTVGHFKETIHQMQQQLETWKRILPEVKLLSGGERPTVRFYEGKEGLHAVFHDVAKLMPKQMCEIANLDDVYSALDPAVLADVRKILDPLKTQIRVLHRGAIRAPNAHMAFCELLPSLGDFHGDIWIYENRVAFVTFVGKPMTVIIESVPFSDTARVLFEAAWLVCSKGK